MQGLMPGLWMVEVIGVLRAESECAAALYSSHWGLTAVLGCCTGLRRIMWLDWLSGIA